MSDDDATGTPARRKTSREILIEAVRWATAKGLRVLATAEPGIRCASTATCEWEPDPTATGVSPLGAAVLMRQEQARGALFLSPSLDRACFLAVGESVRWVDGFSAGVAGVRPDPSWTEHPAGPIYFDGWATGKDIFNVATMAAAARGKELVTCPHHRWIKHEPGSACSRCGPGCAQCEFDQDEETTEADPRPEQERKDASDPNLTPVVTPAPGRQHTGETPHGA